MGNLKSKRRNEISMIILTVDCVLTGDGCRPWTVNKTFDRLIEFRPKTTSVSKLRHLDKKIGPGKRSVPTHNNFLRQ